MGTSTGQKTPEEDTVSEQQRLRQVKPTTEGARKFVGYEVVLNLIPL